MIIKLIAENDAEKARFGGAELVEHINAKEYFIMGNKLDPEGSIVDFHEWTGSFRFLLGSLSYFHEIINDERRNSARRDQDQELPILTGSDGKKFIPMIKKGQGGKIMPLDISKLKLQGPQNVQDEAAEDEFIDDNPHNFTPQDEQLEAEDQPDTIVNENLVNEAVRNIKSSPPDMKKGLRIVP